MKNIPNIISVSRILLSIIMYFVEAYSILFWLLYSACGVSDIIDGYIARKTNCESRLGSILDSVADIVFISAAIMVFVSAISIPTGILLWIILIAFIKITSLLIGYFKYRAFVSFHTYLNKATGLILFCFPYLYNVINTNLAAILVCTVASISATEEFAIVITSKELSRNTKGLFIK